jgi:hypothetical protein
VDAKASYEDQSGDFFTASGQAELDRGFVIVPGVRIRGMATSTSRSPGSLGRQTVVIHINRGSHDEVRSIFVIPKAGLSMTKWLRWDDSVSTSPCSGSSLE